MNVENANTRLESILERFFQVQGQKGRVVGTSSPLSLSYFLSQTNSKKLNGLPHLVVFSTEAECLHYVQNLEFFDPGRHVSYLPGFDVSPFSGLSASPKVVFERLRFLSRAFSAKPGEIFVASVKGLCQKTLPYSVFSKNTFSFSLGDELPESVASLLQSLGYDSAPLVEDVGQFAFRGGILDLFSPAQSEPVRVELFGDQIQSLRTFSTVDQKSLSPVSSFTLVPAKEVLFLEENYEQAIQSLRDSIYKLELSNEERDELIRQALHKNYFLGSEFQLPYFYSEPSFPHEFFSSELSLWFVDPLSLNKSSDELLSSLKEESTSVSKTFLTPDYKKMFRPFEELVFPSGSRQIDFSNLDFSHSTDANEEDSAALKYRTLGTTDFSNLSLSSTVGGDSWVSAVKSKLHRWKEDGYSIFIATKNSSQAERLHVLLEKCHFHSAIAQPQDFLWLTWLEEQSHRPDLLHLIPRSLSESLRLEEERIVFLRSQDFFGKQDFSPRSNRAVEDFQSRAKQLSFGDLKPGDYVVHTKHGIGQYEGLKVMPINGADSEFIQIAYKDKDRLYLPVYRVAQLQKYAGASASASLNKLGGSGWEKTKVKVKSHLREVAHDLLQLYAKRAEIRRPAFSFSESEIRKFENGFPYEETEDQFRAISDIVSDLSSDKPMDRLICGDVGFGKTEVAMRAVFFAVQNKKQVAILAPTTVLTFQHIETFKKRFHGWPVDIRVLNRFVSSTEAKKTLLDTKEGRVDVLIGTHRLLSKDVAFKDLGLLVIDEEQKFGVTHKEKIKKLRSSVDTLALSATPIPRTLNMSLVGVRDLSLINTAPIDRLPTRTFICKFDPETIRKAVQSEIQRGGQVYFIHNRIQSIYGLADEIRQILPTARIRVAHGQMPEEELEKTMLSFFHHEIDVLVCTAIVESGMDVSRANTMFIDQAHLFGLSQLYQLRGRVGRSKQRAYCYLILPRQKALDKEAQERLKVIQENTALGSGIKIAQYDLELRGSGNLLGEEQSGHISSVGYELYMDLLNESIHEAKGEPVDDLELDPEINLRIPALIPDAYISDIRLRLSYYKALAEIRSESDLEKIEEDLKDQFGPPPEPLINLMGLMLIRRQCKDLGVRDVSAGLKTISLVFTPQTRMKPEVAIRLASRENKKYSITPDQRLNIRMNVISWSAVYEELKYLLTLIH